MGGDFGPNSGTTDTNFIIDGILFPDRTAHPSYYEAQRLQQPVEFDLVHMGEETSHAIVEFSIRNRQTFRSLSWLTLHWSVLNATGARSSVFGGDVPVSSAAP